MTARGDTTADSDPPAMEVYISRHIDASEPEEEGSCEHYHEYTVYGFSRSGRTFTARSYIDAADHAAFLSCLESEKGRLLGPADLIDPLLVEAVDYLHAAGKTALDRLTETEGYVALEVVSRLPPNP